MAAQPQGTPLGLLLRPACDPPRRAPGGEPSRSPEGPGWEWSTSGRRSPWRLARATVKLILLAVSLAATLAGCVLGAAAGLWWWLEQLAAAGPHH